MAKTKVKARMMPLPDFLETVDHGMTTGELAAVLGIPAGTIYRQAKAGRIPSFRVGFAVRFDPAVIAKWLRGAVAVLIPLIPKNRVSVAKGCISGAEWQLPIVLGSRLNIG